MMVELPDITEAVRAYHPQADLDLLDRAYAFAERAHHGQVRHSGEPYFAHPVEVCRIIAELKLDVPSLCAGLLHDVVEDTKVTLESIERAFGPDVAGIVDGVTKLSKISFSTREQRQAENFRKMLVAMARDIRVLLVKLADRTHNMRTLEYVSGDKRERIAQETLDIYSPLAHRLGVNWLRTELEDLALRYLNPEVYYGLAEKVAVKKKAREEYIEEVQGILVKELRAYSIPAEVAGRPKHLYSIYRKMQRQGVEFEQVHDLIAFRAIVDTVPQCYEALGVVHNKWKPIPGRFKDYIAIPKPNMYQSLHTTLIGPQAERMEIQIRTKEMHRVAEHGICAHWVYKEGRVHPSRDEEKFAWLRQLMEWQQELTDPTEFLETVRIDLFADEVYVFTPKGDVKALPRDSSPVDFAYAIHTQVGERCVGAKVNGRLVPLRYQLRNGDNVEILTSPHQRPSKDWLKFVKTSKARTKIRHIVREAERERGKEIGREILERELRRFGLSLSKLEKGSDLEEAARHLKCATLDDLYVALGYGKVEAGAVVKQILPEEKLKDAAAKAARKEASVLGQLIKRVAGTTRTGITVHGVDDVMVRFAKCCNPVPGDEVIGFITRGRGVTVHTSACPRAFDTDPARRLDVHWDGAPGSARPVNVKVVCMDKPGLLATMSQCFTSAGVNIASANCTTTADNRAVNTFQVNVTDLKQLKEVMRRIERIQGVVSVERVRA